MLDVGESQESPLIDDVDDVLLPDEVGSELRDLDLLDDRESVELELDLLDEKSLFLVRASPIICLASLREVGCVLVRPIMLSSCDRDDVDIDSFCESGEVMMLVVALLVYWGLEVLLFVMAMVVFLRSMGGLGVEPGEPGGLLKGLAPFWLVGL